MSLQYAKTSSDEIPYKKLRFTTKYDRQFDSHDVYKIPYERNCFAVRGLSRGWLWGGRFVVNGVLAKEGQLSFHKLLPAEKFF